MSSTPRPCFRPLPTLAVLLFLAGCSTSPLSPVQPSGQNPGQGSVPASPTAGLLATTSRVVSVTVSGATGAVLRNGDWTVKIPAGAFSGAGLVTLTVPDPAVRSCELHILPSSLNTFRVPVTLSCRLQSTDELQTYRMMLWDASLSAWIFVPSTGSATTMTCDAPLQHFSTYRCGKAGW